MTKILTNYLFDGGMWDGLKLGMSKFPLKAEIRNSSILIKSGI